MDRYEYIIELGKALPTLDETHKAEENLVKGCQSKVWLTASLENGKIVYLADSNTVITKGIIAILIRLFSNQTPDVVLKNDLSIINAIDLRAHLSSQRSNGLTAMVKMMKQYALVFKQQLEVN
ncbi:UNVERIFIED_CONTAM: hypothetical protein GTU68_056021 [Idotea baltica]|nr:hypothetical protein [Idotea baltica]